VLLERKRQVAVRRKSNSEKARENIWASLLYFQIRGGGSREELGLGIGEKQVWGPYPNHEKVQGNGGVGNCRASRET